ncbi:ArsC/Spx/MgsR family protein [Bacillus thuringiensis]|uniref:ArsC/Spx/MgsR family protein n=1 Tax=Bacillus thuringiensis TaxID=1428 RepID=UPI0021D67AA6|nr:ArsC/Spx/MgsR family protein [Bacillus thuringiensis]MCU7666803.1 hypothetical protein [Bacillus thuringiensis]
MINLYIKSSCQSSRKTVHFFNQNGIEYKATKLQKDGISKADLKKILFYTENGIEDILTKNSFEIVEHMSTEEFYDFIVDNPTALRTPIMLQRGQLLVGFNEDDIRTFLPRRIKKIAIERVLQLCV